MAIHFTYPQTVPPRFQTILERISEVLGRHVVVDQVGFEGDENWLQFHVPGLTDDSACMTMQAYMTSIFGGERDSYQVLTPWHPSSGRGLWLHFLSDGTARAEYRAGPCWF
jgi:hypothetical protein